MCSLALGWSEHIKLNDQVMDQDVHEDLIQINASMSEVRCFELRNIL